MKAYFENEYGKLYHGNCFEIMGQLPQNDNYVVITDPPFNAGKDFENDKLSQINFKAFCNQFALSLHFLSPINILVEVGKNDSTMRDELSRYFDYKYAICLNYTNSIRNGAIGFSNFGLVLWFSRNGKCFTRYKDRLDSAIHNTRDEFSHPSPKEIIHYSELVRMFSSKESVVIDPFLGSGTTALACEKWKRKYIGIDSNINYLAIAKKRIRTETRQLTIT